jgi:hypothetical protein
MPSRINIELEERETKEKSVFIEHVGRFPFYSLGFKLIDSILSKFAQDLV